jgi:hypothetical protein
VLAQHANRAEIAYGAANLALEKVALLLDDDDLLEPPKRRSCDCS